MSANRHLGRIIALQTLYEQEFRLACDDKNLDVDEILTRNIRRYRDTIEDQKFISELVHGVLKEQNTLDELLQPVAPDWPIDQIARMDRTILRMGVYELLHIPSTPHKVAINEAVELAKAFGSENSSKFVNGVLGTVQRQRHPEEEGNTKPQAKKESAE
jgi:N utilization substance protein B